MAEKESQFASELETQKQAAQELVEKQRRIFELQKLAERGTPEQRTKALRKLHKLLRGEEKEK